MLSKYFIERPVLGNVIAIIMMILGAVSIFGLPISQYPPMTPPTIQVSTSWPGASAAMMQQMVASSIETQVNGVENMLYMQSDSTNDGRYTLTVTFEVGTDPNIAQVNVQNRVAIAVPGLPQSVQKQGITTKMQSTAILQFVTLTSDDPSHDALFLSNFANLQMQNRLARIKGVAAANVFGVGNYSMRIWLDPAQLAARSLTPSDISNAISRQNVMLAGGQIGAPPVPNGQDFQYTLNVLSAMNSPEEFGNILVKVDDQGAITRLQDVGRVELGSQNYSQFFKLGDKPAGGIAIYQLPSANAIATAKAVRAEMEAIAQTFPKDMSWEIPFDTTMFVTASIDEVYHTLFEAGFLVLAVIMIFLQDWRAVLVPATTVPVTIIGAFAAMASLGFSINLLTLFAIVLCIGIVVDDAIVVVEGVAKKVEHGETPHDAAVNAMTELMGPIIGITLVLMAVFLPASFISGITGQMYRQFALVIAATALISGINAVTLKPTQAATFIKPKPLGVVKKNWFFKKFDQGFEKISNSYAGLMQILMNHRKISMTVGFALIAFAIYGLVKVPTGFIPNEDQGYLVVSVQLPNASSLQRTTETMANVAKIIETVPGVQKVVSVGGINALNNSASQANAGVMYVILKPWDERAKSPGEDLRSIFPGLSAKMQSVQEATVNVLLPPAIPGLGLSGGFQMQVVLTDLSNDYQKLARATDALAQAVSARPEVMLAFTPFRATVPQYELKFNAARAETLGVSLGDAYDVLQNSIGSTYVNQFFTFGQTYQVYIQADGKDRVSTDQIGKLYVKSSTGSMVPLGSFVDITETTGPGIASQYNLFPTAALLGAANGDYSSGQAMAAVEEVAKEVLPPGVSFYWTAMSYQEKLVGNTVVLVFALSILLVYLVLAAQYESWVAPFAVILAVPLALVGVVAALFLTGLPNNIYVQIGLVLMIALASKNAILIVEVALEERRHHGLSLIDAALKASHERFRPIVMTSIAFILGVVPLLTSSGAGAASRISIGLTVFSGMIASTVFAVALVPIFFVQIEGFFEARAKKSAEKKARALAWAVVDARSEDGTTETSGVSKNKNASENELTDISLGEVILRRLDLAENELAITDEMSDKQSAEPEIAHELTNSDGIGSEAETSSEPVASVLDEVASPEQIAEIEPVETSPDPSPIVEPSERVAIDIAPDPVEDLPAESAELPGASDLPSFAEDFLTESEQPAFASETQLVTEGLAEPVTAPVVEPVVEPVTAPVVEPLPVAEPVAEPVVAPVVEPVTLLVAEPVPVPQAVTEPDQAVIENVAVSPLEVANNPTVFNDDALRQMFRNAAEPVPQAALQPVAEAVPEPVPESVQELAANIAVDQLDEINNSPALNDDALRRMFKNAADEVNGNGN